jgi:hypothetical protein
MRMVTAIMAGFLTMVSTAHEVSVIMGMSAL